MILREYELRRRVEAKMIGKGRLEQGQVLPETLLQTFLRCQLTLTKSDVLEYVCSNYSWAQ